jgi:uncharacterized membrane protein
MFDLCPAWIRPAHAMVPAERYPMKKILAFLGKTTLAGLFVLLPVLLVWMLIEEALEMIIGLATPIAGLLLGDSSAALQFPLLVAIVLLTAISLILGLTMRSAIGRGMGRWIEALILKRLPGYTAIKRLTSGFIHSDERVAFKPALLVNHDGDLDVVYLIEDHGDGMATVLLPWAPTPFAGSVKIIDRSRLKMLDANLGDFSKVLSHWGVGVKDLMLRG